MIYSHKLYQKNMGCNPMIKIFTAVLLISSCDLNILLMISNIVLNEYQWSGISMTEIEFK